MMTKEQFIKRMKLIQNFHSEQETLNVLIGKLCDGYPIVDFGGYLVDTTLDMIAENLGLSEHDDTLVWWLYEDVDKVIYEGKKGEDGYKEINVRTLDELWVYLSGVSR